MNVPKQQLIIELEGVTYEEQFRNLRNLICSISEMQCEERKSDQWPIYFSVSGEGCIRQAQPPKPCALCSGPAHSGPCYYRDGVTP